MAEVSGYSSDSSFDGSEYCGGDVELHGEINTSDPQKALFIGKQCACYEYAIEEYQYDGHSGSWQTVEGGSGGSLGTLRDDTGGVAVNLERGSVEDGTKWEVNRGRFDDPSEGLQGRLDDLGVDGEGWFGANKRMCYSETRIESGNEVVLVRSCEG